MRGERLDHLGALTSSACAVHCAVSPLLVPMLPVALGHLAGSGLEWAFAAVSATLGLTSLVHSYRALHRQALPLVVFSAGFAALLLARLLGEKMPGIEGPAVAVGASCIIGAHIHNLRLRRHRHAPGACPCACHDE